MRFVIWEPGMKKQEGEIMLRLVELGGGIDVTSVNENGDAVWYIAELTEEGKLYKQPSIGDNEYSAGLQLTKNSRCIKMDKS